MKNDVLSYWRMVDPLTVKQAAALIGGCNPSEVRYENVGPSYLETKDGITSNEGIERVQAAYAALTNAIKDGKLGANVRFTAWPHDGWLEIDEDERLTSDVSLNPEEWDTDIVGLKLIKRQGFVYRVNPDWDKTTISVETLNDWLRQRGFPPLFSEFSESTGEPDSGPWPWGGYTTKHLKTIAEVVKEFWSTYDPEQPDTAPTNSEVQDWLMSERGVSKKIAESMATICRADNAPTTRRR